MATDIVARGMASNKLDKSGGIIDGNLAITGNLNVNGTTVTTRQETLFIKDNMIVTNADGLDLQGASGIAIRSGQSVVYGLVYDPTSDTVMFGMGSLDAQNNFTFNTGEGLPIAVRADSSLFVDGHFVKWDATNYCFVDGGSVADIPNQKPFRESWTTTSFTALIADVYADTTVAAGDVYIGVVSGGVAGGMPFNGNAEVRIEVNTANRGVLHCEVTSSNVAPYHWECQVVSGVIYSWRSWVLTKPDGTNDLISNSKINNTYLDTDSTPTENSTKPVQSGGVYSALSNKLGTSGNGSSTTVTFTDAQERTNVATGETQATLWGKVKKWFADLGTAAFKNVPTSGDASTTEVVMGDDTRLTNSRNAADVYSWAKAATKPTYSYSEITNTPTIPAAQVNSDWSASSGVAEILNKPTIPTALSDLSSDATHRLVTDTEKLTWSGKQDALTFDNSPTLSSNNPVKSGGVYDAEYEERGLWEGMAFKSGGLYWNVLSTAETLDAFLSKLTIDPNTGGLAACILHFDNGYGIYSVPLEDLGGTGYAVALVDEGNFTPLNLLYITESNATNDQICSQYFGLSVNNSGWQTNLSDHMYFGSNMTLSAFGITPNDRDMVNRIGAFFGVTNKHWEMLDSLYGTVLGEIDTVLGTLISGTGV